MTAVRVDVVVPAGREATEPPEARGLARDRVRLLVGGPSGVSHHRFTDLPQLLRPGDVLVVNRSGTLPAAVDVAGSDLVVHFSTGRPDGSRLVELRQRVPGGATTPYPAGSVGDRLPLAGGAQVTLRERYAGGRLWVVEPPPVSLPSYLQAHGRPIRYGYLARDWPLEYYQTVFASRPGSAELPSAGRPFTAELVTRLVTAGIGFAPITLHTGVSSLEDYEPPYPEWFEVPAVSARVVNQAVVAGARVVAVGTTAARAIETVTAPDGPVAAPDGPVRAGSGWTDLVISPASPPRVVTGLLTGFHEPRSSHLALLAAVAGEELLGRCYAAAVAGDYRWHEFGDLNLLLR